MGFSVIVSQHTHKQYLHPFRGSEQVFIDSPLNIFILKWVISGSIRTRRRGCLMVVGATEYVCTYIYVCMCVYVCVCVCEHLDNPLPPFVVHLVASHSPDPNVKKSVRVVPMCLFVFKIFVDNRYCLFVFRCFDVYFLLLNSFLPVCLRIVPGACLHLLVFI